MVDCDKIRKIVLKQINPDNSVSETIIYFNAETMEQYTVKQAQQCNNILSIEIDCATTCN